MNLLKRITKKSEVNYKYDHYKSLDFITVFCFFMTTSTGDYRYILKLDDYENLPDVNIDELKEVWDNINSEFEDTDESNGAVIHFTRSKSVHGMEKEYLMLYNLYNMLCIAPEHELTLQECNHAKITPDPKKIHKRLKALSNKIELKRKDIKEVSENTEKLDIWEIIARIEDFRGFNIDVHKTSMRQYIAIKKTLNGRKRQNNAEGRN